MAPRSQSPAPAPALPAVEYIVCAACWPLSEAHALRAGIRRGCHPDILCTLRRFELREAVPFPTLRAWVASSPAAQEAIAQVETARSRGGAKKPRLTHEETAGSARAALLLGKGRDFIRHYKAYTEEFPYIWHPDLHHTLFWDSVLGPGWAGADSVPEGPAREDLQLLAADAYAFFAPPPGFPAAAGLCGAPANYEWLEIAAALRAADTPALETRPDSAAARAALAMLAGRFEPARKEFEAYFGRSEDSRYALVQKHGLPLLTYAIICGILSGGSSRHLRVWFNIARYALESIFPPSMKHEQGELMRFFDHLEQVDALLNRNGTMAGLPTLRGNLAPLPFAMAFSSLPAYVRHRLKPNTLARAVNNLAEAGLRLLACYGAAGLRGAEGLSPKWKACMETLLAEGAAGVPTLPSPVSERACEALVESVNKYARQGYLPLRVPDALTPVLIASRTLAGVELDLSEAEVVYEEDCPPALRCLRRYSNADMTILEGATSAEFTRLFVAMMPQVDIIGSLALPGEPLQPTAPEPILLLAHLNGGECLASLRLRLLPGTSPLMVAGCGLSEPVLTGEDGRAIPVQRDTKAEWKLMESTVRRLKQAGCQNAETLLHGSLSLHGLGQLASLLDTCRELGLLCAWEKGYELKLHQPQSGLRLHLPQATHGWLELGGGLPVDEGRVLELTTLLEAYGQREDNTLCLAGGEYVLLTPELEHQLALLQLVLQEQHGKPGIAAAARPLLDALTAAETPQPAPPAALPSGLKATLRPYQLQGYHWLAERAEQGLGALLADDMGLGKTLQVLALLLHMAGQPGAGAALVIAPVSLLGNWAQEAARFAPSLRVITYNPRHPEALAEAGAGCLVLASYGHISSRQQDFTTLANPWGVLVLDEAQAIKNPDSQRAKAACTLPARVRLCLTGTPIENNLLDLWSQIRFLNPGLLAPRAAFLRRYRKAKPTELSLLRHVLAPLMLRRTKAEVLTQLPPLTETIEWVEFSREERALYESLRRTAVQKLGQEEGAGGGISILAELTRLRRACCHGKLALPGFAGSSAKLTAMAERVADLRAAGRRVLIFSQFTDVLDLAQHTLQSGGISCLRLDGSTPAAQRTQTVRQFQQGGADAFLISLKAGGAGLNLTAADYVILLDPWWNPASEAQAAGRSHRLGQANPVTLCRFMVRGSVEERILALHAEKKELADNVLSGRADGLSLSNLRALLA